MNMYFKSTPLMAVLLAAAALSACVDDGTGSVPLGTLASSSTLSGIAAAGAPLAGASFTITSLTSNTVIASGAVENSGFYQSSLTAASAPYVIVVTDSSVLPVKTYKAIVVAADLGSTMNVTPITDMVANIALNDPAVVSALSSASGSSTATATATLAAALATARTGATVAVQTALAPLLATYGVTDTGNALLTHAFTPTLDPVDKVLDAFTSNCSATACTIALKSAAATTALGTIPLVIPTASVASASTAASTVAAALGSTAVMASVQKVAPVVVVLRAVSSWGTAADTWAGYTGSISIYNFTDKDFSGAKALYFESKTLQAAGFWNATAVTGGGKFQLTMPTWGSLPAASAGGASKPFVIGFNGSGTLASALDITSCNIGGEKCIVMIDNGTLGSITANTGTGTGATAAAAVRSWSAFVTSLSPAILSNSGNTNTTLNTPVPVSSPDNGKTTPVGTGTRKAPWPPRLAPG